MDMSRSILTLMLISCLCCSCRRHILPKDEVFDTLIAMYRTDALIEHFPEFGDTADTTRVYEALFEKRGYNSALFFKSLNHYLQRPGKFRSKLYRIKTSMADERRVLQEHLKTGRERNMERQHLSRWILDSIVPVQQESRQQALRHLLFPESYETPWQFGMPDTCLRTDIGTAAFWTISFSPSCTAGGVPVFIAVQDSVRAGKFIGKFKERPSLIRWSSKDTSGQEPEIEKRRDSLPQQTGPVEKTSPAQLPQSSRMKEPIRLDTTQTHLKPSKRSRMPKPINLDTTQTTRHGKI